MTLMQTRLTRFHLIGRNGWVRLAECFWQSDRCVNIIRMVTALLHINIEVDGSFSLVNFGRSTIEQFAIIYRMLTFWNGNGDLFSTIIVNSHVTYMTVLLLIYERLERRHWLWSDQILFEKRGLTCWAFTVSILV